MQSFDFLSNIQNQLQDYFKPQATQVPVDTPLPNPVPITGNPPPSNESPLTPSAVDQMQPQQGMDAYDPSMLFNAQSDTPGLAGSPVGLSGNLDEVMNLGMEQYLKKLLSYFKSRNQGGQQQ